MEEHAASAAEHAADTHAAALPVLGPFDLNDPAFWAFVGLVIFLAVVIYMKVPGTITKSLDDRAAKITSELAAAEALRKEAEAKLADVQKRAAEAEASLDKMRDEKDTADAIAKAKSLNFGKAEEVGPLLMRVNKGLTTAADAELLERLFKAAGEQGKVTHLFKSVGSDVAVDGDPEVLIKAKAGEIQKANNGMTFEQAYAKAMEENPSLYNAYIAKRRAG